MQPQAAALGDAARTIRGCSVCGNLDTIDPCAICRDPHREEAVICVVEDVGDLWAMERGRIFNGRYHVLPYFWVPEEGARRREHRDRVPYVQWIRNGYIQATPGEVIDYDRIRKFINDLGTRYHIRQIALDRWNGTQLATQLEGDDFEMVAL